MLRYVLRRILLAVPTLLVISMAVFGLSKCAPYDSSLGLGEVVLGNMQQQAADALLRAEALGADKPTFYFTLTTAAFPDTLHRVFPYSRRERMKRLCAQTGDWPLLSRFELALWDLAAATDHLPDTLGKVAGDFRGAVSQMLRNDRASQLAPLMADIRAKAGGLLPNALPTNLIDSLQTRVAEICAHLNPGRMNVPAVHWHGLDNQYHQWLSGFVVGNWGMSTSKKPVWEWLRLSLLSTLIINGLAIMLAYLVAVPLGVAMARRRDRFFDRAVRWGLLFLYSMPLFWLGSLLIILFATPHVGLHLINGIAIEMYHSSGKTYLEWCLSNFDKFILPILTLSLHALAILALQMRGGMLDALGQDYIRTARAKGLAEHAVHWRHAFRNALFPLITVFASVFPAIFTGSLVVEYLFQFPGLGTKTYEAYALRDYPVLFTILMLAATFTVLGNLLADMLYAWADPRVRFSRK